MESQTSRTGIVYTAGAYVMWGLLPLYWKLIQNVSSEEILAHRIIWSFVFMLFLLGFRKRLGPFWAVWKKLLHHPRPFITLILASLLISVNWFLYIWAVNHDHIIETSLGYYMNPLISILLGMVVLKEKLNFWQLLSVVLAAIGVTVLTVQFGSFPWVAVSLAVSFAIYGLAKKLTNFDAEIGLTMETLVITPLALIYLLFLTTNGSTAFEFSSLSDSLLLMGSGIATALPLLYFAKGAKLIPLSMVGFLQYIAPSISLFLGVFLYHEHFTKVHMTAFFFIWTALVVFSFAKTKFMVNLEPKFGKDKSVKAS
ncbi:EamA family transporter RarD [Bacillus benzoevorans]|uniref:Chloramphenicol-sensitive protein RarD n=1 Tax=Bacillus benzoevorans TaxID=1456 RepID=A0A7X0HRD8_9BACI|nr:EamA family transporter RarD [Bacillus benzoevorans]MBB6444362.1 chloramphenicol-sensitive protein RarD [Bacillus benzoevorans]